MPAALTAAVVDAAPGNVVTIKGSGLTGGSGASVVIANQGVLDPPGLSPAPLTLATTFASDGNSVAITIPDGVMPGTVTVTAHDSTTATCALRIVSQYVQAAEYIGEGVDTSGLAPGELDVILRRASSYADRFMGDSIRLLQVVEKHRYRAREDVAPVIWPRRVRGRDVPVLSVDQLAFVSSNQVKSVFNTDDSYTINDNGSIEVLAYAIGDYALLGALERIGYSANVVEIAYTSGFPVALYPAEVRDATITIATEILSYRRIQADGLGGLSRVKKGQVQYDRRNEPFAIPTEARELLARYSFNGGRAS